MQQDFTLFLPQFRNYITVVLARPADTVLCKAGLQALSDLIGCMQHSAESIITEFMPSLIELGEKKNIDKELRFYIIVIFSDIALINSPSVKNYVWDIIKIVFYGIDYCIYPPSVKVSLFYSFRMMKKHWNSRQSLETTYRSFLSFTLFMLKISLK